ncbi:CCA tRNA nucleotidyltransferase [Patulibacter americanus]|uniref:CCA tRNA nucleotidyltransferase n=1 Tax=Patulibacter americanus TaxID=588672 RepID=UPI0003B372F0|nr:CCA tRNA nucleotidyltransferase [Patulibacter americanus]
MTAVPAPPSGDGRSYGPAADAVLSALREALAADGTEGWVVGGAVRERLRGRPTHDLDVALAGDGDAVRHVTRRVARTVGGHAFPLSDAFGAWRATSRPEEERAWQLDVTPLQGRELDDDLGRRDLTVNALAEPVGGGALVDLFGGRVDLGASRLRLVAPDALERDPVRVVRLARFAAELEADPDDAALRAARAAAPALVGVPGERVLPELLRALAGPAWERGLRALEATGALAALLPGTAGADGSVPATTRTALRGLLGAPEGPGFPGDVGLLGVPEARPADDAALRARAVEPRAREVLVLAALLAGSADAGAALDGLRPSRDLRTAVARAVAAVRRIAGLSADADPEALFAALGPAGTDAPEGVLLARALAAGTGPPWAALAARAVRWAGGPPRPPVTGDALARELGLRPGPELGRLLRALAVAHDAGAVTGPDDAVRLARALRASEAEPAPPGG